MTTTVTGLPVTITSSTTTTQPSTTDSGSDWPMSVELFYTTAGGTTVHFGYDGRAGTAPETFVVDGKENAPGGDLTALTVDGDIHPSAACLALLGGAEKGDRSNSANPLSDIITTSFGLTPAPQHIHLEYGHPDETTFKVAADVSTATNLDGWVEKWPTPCFAPFGRNDEPPVRSDGSATDDPHAPAVNPSCSGTVLHATGDGLNDPLAVTYHQDVTSHQDSAGHQVRSAAFHSVTVQPGATPLTLGFISSEYAKGMRTAQTRGRVKTKPDISEVTVELVDPHRLAVTTLPNGKALERVNFGTDKPTTAGPDGAPQHNALAPTTPDVSLENSEFLSILDDLTGSSFTTCRSSVCRVPS